MQVSKLVLLIVIGLSALASDARAAPPDTCKECSDHRKRCMANYPGPTCKTEYDICMKGCRR
jgi:hypothetical protein